MKVFLWSSLLLVLLFLTTCVDPVVPAYDFEEDFILVEGQIVDQAGFSEIRLSRSEILFENYTLVPITGATVSSIDGNGNEVSWQQIGTTSAYAPPADFAAQSGQSYFLRVTTPTGQVIESLPETTPSRVPVAEAELRFEQEAFFSDARNRFIPAFRLLVDLEDPADADNYYQWRFREWAMIEVCASCMRARWRNGECIESPDTRFVNRWDYLCDAPCWILSQGNQINILSDEFSQGRRIDNIEAAVIEFDRLGGLLVDLEQYSISKANFDYSTVLKDLADGAGGLNATLPAALIGNLRDVSDSEVNVLGFVGVSSLEVERVYINRDTVNGTPLPFDATVVLEPVNPSPPLAPCVGENRTTERPIGWPE